MLEKLINMRILFFTDNFPPEKNAPAKRTFQHVQKWASDGNNIEIITCAPNFPLGRVFKGYKNSFYSKEYINNIKVSRVWTFIVPNKGFFLRILDYMSFMFTSLFYAIFFTKVDVVIATSPQFFTAVAGYIYSIIRNVPFVLEIRDLWPESIISLNNMNDTIFTRFLKKIAILMYKKADIIITVTNTLKDDISRYGIDKDKIHVITNGVIIDEPVSHLDKSDVYKKYSINDDSFIISYIGTIGQAHGLEVILEAAKISSNNNYLFLIIGEGSEKERLTSMTNDWNLKNIIFLDSLNWEEIVDIQQIININLVHLKPINLFKGAIPSKIFESMYFSKPIILGLEGEAEEIIISSNSGLIMKPGCKESLIHNIDYLFNNQDLANILGKNGNKWVKINYNRDNLADKMINVIKDKVEKKVGQ